MPLTYSTATIDALPQLMALAQLSYGQFRSVLTAENWAEMERHLTTEKFFTDILAHATTLTCLDGNTLAGVAYLMPTGHPTKIYPADWAYIRMVGVHPAYRGQGIAKKLTQQCIDTARKNGEKHIGLHTSEIMDDARHIYQNLGFTIERELPDIYGVRYWLYKLDL